MTEVRNVSRKVSWRVLEAMIFSTSLLCSPKMFTGKKCAHNRNIHTTI